MYVRAYLLTAIRCSIAAGSVARPGKEQEGPAYALSVVVSSTAPAGRVVVIIIII